MENKIKIKKKKKAPNKTNQPKPNKQIKPYSHFCQWVVEAG